MHDEKVNIVTAETLLQERERKAAELEKARATVQTLEQLVQALDTVINFYSEASLSVERLPTSEALVNQASQTQSYNSLFVEQEEGEGKTHKNLINYILMAIDGAERFLNISEIKTILPYLNYPGTLNSVSTIISLAPKEQQPVKIRFDKSSNSWHYGLPEFAREVNGKVVFKDESVLPKAVKEGKYRAEEAEFVK